MIRARVAATVALLCVVTAPHPAKAQWLLDLLKLRGLDVPAEVRDRILGCTELTLLDAWFKRALGVREAREIFDDATNPKT